MRNNNGAFHSREQANEWNTISVQYAWVQRYVLKYKSYKFVFVKCILFFLSLSWKKDPTLIEKRVTILVEVKVMTANLHHL